MKNGKKDQLDDPSHALVAELKDIKKLLVLLLLKGGATQTEIAKALGRAQETVSKQFRLGGAKPFETALVNMGNGEEG
jgi:DNA-binding NarL/FixJ family response regulator